MTSTDLIIEPYFQLPAACHAYDPLAPEIANRLIAMIVQRQPRMTAEHVGSSSVPGCAGKGNIDLMLLYPPGELEAAKQVLADLGFQHQLTAHAFPEERPMRTGATRYEGKIFRIHVHVLDMNSPEAAEMRRFRDILLHRPDLVSAYVARKQAIISSGITNTGVYAEEKGGFVQNTLKQGQ